MPIIHLGQTVRDVITGFEGVVTSRHEYLHGCARLHVEPQALRDGRPIEGITLDEQRLVALDVPNILEIAPRTNAPGGDRLGPASGYLPSNPYTPASR